LGRPIERETEFVVTVSDQDPRAFAERRRISKLPDVLIAAAVVAAAPDEDPLVASCPAPQPPSVLMIASASPSRLICFIGPSPS
jgi:hypothetical protein